MELRELEKKYNLELDRAVEEIKSGDAKTLLLQFPDGLKPYAIEIAEYLEKEIGVEIKIWLGSCFGACDVPESEVDLLIQFGHSEWKN